MIGNSDNFVEVIGFQLEKVHTGVIAWLLDSTNDAVTTTERTTLLSKLLSQELQQTDAIEINARREYSFGRRRRIDLVAEITNAQGDVRYLLIECKTDSDIDVGQLEQSRDEFQKKKVCEPSCFVVALGASQFTFQHIADEIANLGFRVLNVPETHRLFSGLSIQGSNKIYDDWLAALEMEERRCSTVDQELRQMKDTWDDCLRQKGYRIGSPLYYMFYARLREVLERSPYKIWAIYSGVNNPVMNWWDGWLPPRTEPAPLHLYWEFNWDSLHLKADLAKESHERWVGLRDKVAHLCEGAAVGGKETRNRGGTWVSAYKWKFDFCRHSIQEVATTTIAILRSLHGDLKKLL